MLKRPCECGCGKKLGFGDRQKMKKVTVLDSQVEYLSTVTLPAFTEARSFEEATSFRRFIQEGRGYAKSLRDEVHGTFSSRVIETGFIDQRAALHWAKAAREVEAMTLDAVARSMGAETP